MGYRLTKKHIRSELLRCGRDPKYFINNYIKIAHPEKGLIPFKLFDFQEDVVDNVQDYRFNIIVKARQLGLSTTVAGYVTWLLLFHREKNVVIMATKLATAANLVRKVKLAMKSLPEWMMISKIVIDNRNSFELDNGSQVKAISTSGDAGRSEALSLLVIDEAAIIDGLDELWAGLYPTLSTGGSCVIFSTPYGVGNMFHKLYSEAEQGLNDFHHMKLPWDIHPERDQEWFDKETRNMSKRDIAQELLCSFNMSGDTLIDGEDLDRIYNNVKEPILQTGIDRNLWVWKKFEAGKRYVMVVDVARGDGQDNSAFHVFDVDSMEQVAEYQGKLPTDTFAHVVMQGYNDYGKCLTVVENNNIGSELLLKLKELGHANIYYSKKTTHEQIESHEAEYTSGVQMGFTTSSKTRPLVLSKLEEFIRNKVLKINSIRLFNELKTFVWQNGKAQAMRSYNDDLVLSCAISCWIRSTALMGFQADIDYHKALMNSFRSTRTYLDPDQTKANVVNNYKERKSEKDAQVRKTFFTPFFIR